MTCMVAVHVELIKHVNIYMHGGRVCGMTVHVTCDTVDCTADGHISGSVIEPWYA